MGRCKFFGLVWDYVVPLDKSPHPCYNIPEAHRKASLPSLRARTGGLPPLRLRGRALWYAPRLSRSFGSTLGSLG